MYKLLVVLFFLVISGKTWTQIFPQEGRKLNYRIIGFSFPSEKETSKYKIEIAVGNYSDEGSFKKNIFKTFISDTNRIIGEVPSFGKEYTWRIAFTNKNLAQTKSELHHFSTLIIPEVDTSVNRLRIIKHAKKYKDAYVFLDVSKTLYDMNGMPVWFLPDSLRTLRGKTTMPKNPPCDIKISPFGTITLMARGIYEINYNCDILWMGPGVERLQDEKGIPNRGYHHELTRLSNGHYMVFGTEVLLCKLPSLADSSFILVSEDSINKDNDTAYQKLEFGTLIEYDEKGNVVWMWRSSKYILESDLFPGFKNRSISPFLHDNAFFFDEQHKTVYISFRSISRVIKVKYPEGKVLDTYGDVFNAGVKEKKNIFFCGQHSCKLTREEHLLLYNNNDCDTVVHPSIVMMQEPLSGKDALKKIWEYECTMNDDGIIHTKNNLGKGGGNVIELPDNSIFACMGYIYGKVFIVNRNKEIIWSAMAEKWDPDGKKWDMRSSYRASIITDRKELERLIWNAERN